MALVHSHAHCRSDQYDHGNVSVMSRSLLITSSLMQRIFQIKKYFLNLFGIFVVREKVIEFCSQKKLAIAKDPQLFLQQLENQQAILAQPEISDLASLFSPIQELRQIIRELVRDLVKDRGFVVVGRDMTFKVLPEAEIKVFLTADQLKRVERRHQQLKESAKLLSPEEVKKDLIERDKRDE